jgi:putative flippase GtrA
MIKKFIKNNFWKFIIFCFVGFCAFLIDWGIFNIFYYLGLGFIVSITFSWLGSMIFNFTINRNVTFSARNKKIKNQIFKWLVVYFIAFLARVGLGKSIFILFEETVLIANIAFFAGIAIAIPISFLGSLLWVFKK